MALKDFPVHATLAASDLARARAFYEQKLGFVPTSVTPGGVFYASAGGTTFLVYPSGTAGTNKATYAGWAVKDIGAVVSDLKARGVTFESYDVHGFDRASSIATFGAVRSAWFKDTEGNILGVVQLPT
jgi:catechol 2,3-dioxygenase-like lactoylglutathione lyase family enzyme